MSADILKIIASLLILLAFLPAAARAQEVASDAKEATQTKRNTLLPEVQFLAMTKKVEEKDPYNEPKISYSLMLPKDWPENSQKTFGTVGQSSLSSNVPNIIARYTAAPKNLVRSYITVEAQALAYEISAKNWFMNFLLGNGFSLTSLMEKDPRNIEALYVQVDGDQTYVVRARVVLNGPNLVMARYYLPQENYEEEKGLQEQIMASFKLTNPSNERIEKQGQYGFLDQSYFNYPESWTLKEKSIYSVERMSAVLYQITQDEKKTYLEGHIRINLISRLLKTTMAQEIADFRSKLNIPNFTIGKLIEEVKYDYDPSIKTGRAQVYALNADVTANLKNYELLVTVMEGDDYYYITSMITPSRTEDFFKWAQNMETARIVNESIRRHNIPLEGNPNDPYYDYLKEAQ